MVVTFQHSSILVSPYTMTSGTEFGEAASRADLPMSCCQLDPEPVQYLFAGDAY